MRLHLYRYGSFQETRFRRMAGENNERKDTWKRPFSSSGCNATRHIQGNNDWCLPLHPFFFSFFSYQSRVFMKVAHHADEALLSLCLLSAKCPFHFQQWKSFCFEEYAQLSPCRDISYFVLSFDVFVATASTNRASPTSFSLNEHFFLLLFLLLERPRLRMNVTKCLLLSLENCNITNITSPSKSRRMASFRLF